MNCATILSLEGILCLSFLSVTAAVQEVPWEQYMAAALEAYKQADFAEAERFYLAALKEAEHFGDEDTRLATSLNNLASVYLLQEKYDQAERLYKRTLAIWEKAFGPEHPSTATASIIWVCSTANRAGMRRRNRFFNAL